MIEVRANAAIRIEGVCLLSDFNKAIWSGLRLRTGPTPGQQSPGLECRFYQLQVASLTNKDIQTIVNARLMHKTRLWKRHCWQKAKNLDR